MRILGESCMILYWLILRSSISPVAQPELRARELNGNNTAICLPAETSQGTVV